MGNVIKWETKPKQNMNSVLWRSRKKCWVLDTGLSLFLKFTTQSFLNKAVSESTAFISAGKHNLNGQAENGWIKLFFSSF